MKLAVAVLSSILLACSVTIANPIDPSATTDAETITSTVIPSETTDVETITSTVIPSETTDVETITSTVIPSETTDVEASTLPTPNPNGIGLDSLDPLSDSIKELLKEYQRKHVSLEEQVKKCELLKSQYKDQQTMVKHAKRKLHVSKHKSLRDGGNRKHGNEIWDNMRDIKTQEAKLADLKKSYKDCKSKYSIFTAGLDHIKMLLVDYVFGESWDLESLDQQSSLITTHPSVNTYLEQLSVEYQELLDQISNERQQHKELSDRERFKQLIEQQQRKEPSNQQQPKDS
ncbi:hypothetical protein MT418_8494 [Batrachochytrium dendrobatidis]